jgi:hypothetical protein
MEIFVWKIEKKISNQTYAILIMLDDWIDVW